jgi:hypothetical protein
MGSFTVLPSIYFIPNLLPLYLGAGFGIMLYTIIISGAIKAVSEMQRDTPQHAI